MTKIPMTQVLTTLVVVTNLVFGVAGQLLIKYGMNQIGGVNSTGLLRFFWIAFTNPFILVGQLLYLAGAFLWLIVLSRLDLSIAYPMLSLGYVFILFLSAWLLHEPVTWVNTLGVLLVCSGVVLVMQR